MGNCGTSVMTPFVLTPSGSCQSLDVSSGMFIAQDGRGSVRFGLHSDGLHGSQFARKVVRAVCGSHVLQKETVLAVRGSCGSQEKTVRAIRGSHGCCLLWLAALISYVYPLLILICFGFSCPVSPCLGLRGSERVFGCVRQLCSGIWPRWPHAVG